MKANVNFMHGTIEFDGIPNVEIRQALKRNGFRWHADSKAWFSRKAISNGLIDWIEDELNPGPKKPDAPCWICKKPGGYFRNMGAATPVWCDDCYETEKAKRKFY